MLTNRSWLDSYGVDVPDMRVFDPGEVKAISAALSTVTDKAFKWRYDPDRLQQFEIYPHVWEKCKDSLFWLLAKYLKLSPHMGYLLFHFNRLKLFLDGADDRDWGLIIKYHE